MTLDKKEKMALPKFRLEKAGNLFEDATYATASKYIETIKEIIPLLI